MEGPTNIRSTRTLPRGLATVAFLKARLDQGVDHIDMFMPLVIDTIANLPSISFSCTDVQSLLSVRHGLAMPQHTLTTLLNRASRGEIIKREFSRYVKQSKLKQADDVQAKKVLIEAQQRDLAEAFRKHASERAHPITSDEEALRLILEFLEENHTAILLGAEERPNQGSTLTSREARLVATFAQHVMLAKSDLSKTLQGILEGLVVYNAAFLRDITSPARNFKGLKVFLDTRIIFQLLGYEGDALATLALETLQLLRTGEVQCLVFDKTLQECRGVLKFFESRLTTTRGTKDLGQRPMTRHFLSARYAPSDIRQMIALLPQELAKLGIQTSPMPRHVPRYTLDEQKLAQALADEQTHDLTAPRVIHDVDCVAAILTLRRGERSVSLSQVKAVFATATGKVVSNVGKWYQEEGETGISPVVHIRALSNLVWLRRPALAVNLKEHELVALCNAALQPSRRTWDRFMEHLNALEKSDKITSEEAVAIVVSEMTEDLLANAEDATIDDDDVIDATTLDEVIERVRSTYQAEAKQFVEKYQAEADARIAEANVRVLDLEARAEERSAQATAFVASKLEAQAKERAVSEKKEQEAAESYQRLKVRVESRALSLARLISISASVLVAVPVLLGAFALLIEHPLHTGLIGQLIGGALGAFVFMELLGIMHHISHLRSRLEAKILPRIRRAVGADRPPPLSSTSFLGLNQTHTDDRE